MDFTNDRYDKNQVKKILTAGNQEILSPSRLLTNTSLLDKGISKFFNWSMQGWWWFGKKKSKTRCTAALAGKAKQLKLLDSFQFPQV